jgi:peptidyl-Asp metalloendopeptidase
LTRIMLAVAGLLVASVVPSPAQVLFGEAPASRSVDAGGGLGVVRSRPVRVRLARIPGASPREAALNVLPPRGHRLVLNLFPDMVVRARMTRSERAGNALVWAGKIEGQPLGDVVLAIVDGVLSGSAVWPGGAYRIRFDGSTHVVEQLDHDLFPEDGCFEEVPGGAADVAAAPVANADDGSVIDVLVVYTPAARAAAGGTPAMLSKISLAIAETNTGYANSGVIQRLRLAAAQEIGYVESGTTTTDMSTDLSRVTGTADGYMDSVHALRDASHADLVSLLVTGYNNPYGACGIAWLMAGNNSTFGPNAFSVVDQTCATGYFSFGHELGHNMGLNHARSDPTGTGAYSYSYGYKWTGYRTVMAYAPGTRVLYFSNPNVTYGGNPTGVSETSASSAYNALSLNNTRVTVANWRQAPTPTASVRVGAPNGGESWPAGSTHSITWTSANLPAGAVVNVTYSDGTARGFTTNRTAGGAIARVPASQGSYTWTVPFDTGNSWRVKLCVPAPASLVRGAAGGSSCLASDASDAPFSIVP